MVKTIANASREEARRLGSISGAMMKLDRVTQQNAAMVHRTSTAAQELASEGDSLTERVGIFTLSKNSKHASVAYPA
ncbi:hypothetical protein [Fulvimarina sp. MAC3]|uniref:hypothetical protein n=1 Tax=Fulvimarina sp. MAC3 TaxID=3148887 RepID=UPI0031FD440A